MELNEIVKQPLLFRKKFSVAGGKVWVLDPQGKMVIFVKQKAFKLKEDIRAYADDSMSKELFLIKARKIIEFSAAYDIFTSENNEKIGTLARKGFKSIIRDEWEIRDVNDNPIGKILEDSTIFALIRRFLSSLVPQNFSFFVGETEVAELKQHFNPFIKKSDFSVKTEADDKFDPRIALAGAILLMIIEGRQN